MNVIGEPVDQMGPIEAKRRDPIHKAAPAFTEQNTKLEMFETGIKVIDLIEPYLRAERSVCSAVPASARPSSFRNSSTTSRPSTAAFRCSPAWASAPAKEMTSGSK